MTTKFKFLALLFFTLTSTTFSPAQWVQANGPYGGGTASAFATLNGSIIAASINGVYLSTNNGLIWTQINSSHAGSESPLAVFNGDIYFGYSGLICSSDQGATWLEVDSGLMGSVYSMAAIPSSTGYNLFAGTSYGIYLSTNKGLSWTNVFTDGAGQSLLVDSSQAGTPNIFVGTWTGVFRSTNNGTSWTGVNNGLTSGEMVNGLAMINSIIFAATEVGIFRSTDHGASWSAVNTGLANTYILSLFVRVRNAGESDLLAGTYGGGVFLSTNNGTSWSKLGSGLPTYAVVYAIAVSGNNILAGTNGNGIFLSSDNGVSWVPDNTGFSLASVSALAGNGSNLYASATVGGIFRSTNEGANWGILNSDISGAQCLTHLSNETGEEYLFAGTSNGGIYCSTDDGLSWSHPDTGLTNGFMRTLTGYSDSSGNFNILAGTAGGGVFRSTNNAASWTPINNGMTSADIWSTAVCPSGSDGINLLTGTGAGIIFLSTNNGASWNAATADVPIVGGIYAFSLVTNKTGGTYLFAGTYGSQVFLSTNNGISWKFAGNVSPGSHITSLAAGIDGSGHTYVFAGTYGNGIFLSIDNGAHWNAVDTGLGTSFILSLLVNGDIPYLYAGTDGSGAWKRPLSDMITSVPLFFIQTPSEFRLEQNYPNPFNPSTTISFSLPSRSFVSLKVFDALGKEVSTLLSEELFAGAYSRQWSGDGLASGVYFCRLQAGSYFQTKKLVLMK